MNTLLFLLLLRGRCVVATTPAFVMSHTAAQSTLGKIPKSVVEPNDGRGVGANVCRLEAGTIRFLAIGKFEHLKCAAP